jgi:hypothetical protein
MREGVELVKLIVFKKLKPGYESKYPDKDTSFAGMLTGAVINDLFGVSFVGEDIEAFTQKYQKAVKSASGIIATDLEHLRIPLTDALRIQFLCDSHEGIDSTSVLKRAQQNNILIAERDAPMPGAFMNIVRSFGRAYGILENELPAPPAAEQMEGTLARGSN